MDGAGKEAVLGADQSLAEFKEIYFKACARPFDLRRELESPLESVPTQIQLYEWEYLHEVRTDRKAITVISLPLDMGPGVSIDLLVVDASSGCCR